MRFHLAEKIARWGLLVNERNMISLTLIGSFHKLKIGSGRMARSDLFMTLSRGRTP